MNKEEIINCPNCGEEIPITQVLRSEIEVKMKADYNKKWSEDRKKRDDEIRKEAENDLSPKMKDLENQLLEKDKRLKEIVGKEVELLKREREVEDMKRDVDLEMEKKLSKERSVYIEKGKKEATESFKFKEKEYEVNTDKMKKIIDELKRELEQGSQQLQGEILELELEDTLKKNFLYDRIEPVAKGVKGADVIQYVINNGKECGAIIWESKRTKSWSEGWITKLKDDQRAVNADVAVIVSTSLPDGVESFSNHEDIWVCSFSTVIELTNALRYLLIELYNMKVASVGKSEKKELMYNYILSNEFTHRVSSIVEAFNTMADDLQKEKTAMEKIWAKREKLIQRIQLGTSGIIGDMEGIAGKSLPELDSVELKFITDGNDNS